MEQISNINPKQENPGSIDIIYISGEKNLKRKLDDSNLFGSSEKKKKAKKKILHFVGNQTLFEDITQVLISELPDVEVKLIDVNIPELQGEPDEIIKNKLKFALNTKAKGHPIVMEDTSLCFNSWNGLPGPYISDFLAKVGLPGLQKMSRTFDDSSAYAQSIFGLTKSKKDGPHLFIGKTEGEIVEPRGEGTVVGWGWDAILKPKGSDKTFGEMSKEEKNGISQRSKALKEMIDFLKNHPDYF